MNEAPIHDQAHGASGEQLSFLDPMPFCPIWPKQHTLLHQALTMFLDGRVFDHLDFIGAFVSWRLSDVVFRLRGSGWPIEAIDIPSPTADRPGRTIAVYKLPAKYIAMALATSAGAPR